VIREPGGGRRREAGHEGLHFNGSQRGEVRTGAEEDHNSQRTAAATAARGGGVRVGPEAGAGSSGVDCCSGGGGPRSGGLAEVDPSPEGGGLGIGAWQVVAVQQRFRRRRGRGFRGFEEGFSFFAMGTGTPGSREGRREGHIFLFFFCFPGCVAASDLEELQRIRVKKLKIIKNRWNCTGTNLKTVESTVHCFRFSEKYM
jgi:hypothetical protein